MRNIATESGSVKGKARRESACLLEFGHFPKGGYGNSVATRLASETQALTETPR